jgi:hypothetical protein
VLSHQNINLTTYQPVKKETTTATDNIKRIDSTDQEKTTSCRNEKRGGACGNIGRHAQEGDDEYR